MEDTNAFYQLLLITGLAFVVPFVVTRVPGRVVPVVVGEIVVGIVIGTSGLDLIEPTDILDFLAEFGFAYLMFLSGLELDASVLTAPGEGSETEAGRRRGPLSRALGSPLATGLTLLAGTFTVAFIGNAVLTLFDLTPDLWLMTLVLSTTSVAIVVPTVKERGLASRPLGQSLLVSAFAADFVTLILISAYAVIKRPEGSNAELILIIALPLAFILAYQLGSTLSRSHWLSRTLEELAHATAQLRVRGALTLMIAFVVLAETIGTELILGSFVAGLIVSLLSPEEGTSIRIKLDAIGFGFFIPIFFINVGVGLDLGALSASGKELVLFPLLLVLAYLAKVVPALLLRLRYSWQETLAGGFLLSGRLSLIIAASIIGIELGIITPGVNSAIVLIAVITSTTSPILFSRILQTTAREENRVIIVGAGETGRSLAARLTAHGMQPVLIEADANVAEAARLDGLEVVTGQADFAETLSEAGADEARALVAVTPDDETNRRACRRAREAFGIVQVIARVNDPAQVPEFSAEGIRPVSVPFSTSSALENAVLRPSLYQILVERPEDYDVMEVMLRNRDFVGRPLRDVRLAGSVLVLLIRRNGQPVVPRGSTSLEHRDLLTLAGDPASVQEAARTLARASAGR